MTFLQVEGLSTNLGEFCLEDVSFSLEQGDYLTIIGPTGAGKTILLESIIGFWTPKKGKIILQDRDISSELPEKRRIGIVYQDYALMPHFTVFKNIAYGLGKQKKHHSEKKIKKIAQSLHIDHLLHRKPETLSGGEQQRVALARALAAKPRLLLMDEPFSALDPQTRQEARQLLKKAVQKTQMTVIHITHNMNDTWMLANKTAVMKSGQMVQFGELMDVVSRPQSQFVARFVGVNTFRAEIESCRNDTVIAGVLGTKLVCKGNVAQNIEVVIAVRPENIGVSKSLPALDNDWNVLNATIISITNNGNIFRLVLQCRDFEVEAVVTRYIVNFFSLKKGDQVYAIIHKEHIGICRSQDQQDLDQNPYRADAQAQFCA